MHPTLDHIQITVRDIDAVLPFYDAMLALLGFDTSRRSYAELDEFDMRVAEYPHPAFSFAISSPRSAFAGEGIHRRRPGAVHHIAFRAGSRAEVDRVHRGLVEFGAEIVGGPKLWPQHGDGYYAVFFKDPDGIKYEIVHAPPME
ncbi:MAG: VOC family protein [Planctomycetes bacterium]|nr:VOC family protein [Planctomycetota bacterium]